MLKSTMNEGGLRQAAPLLIVDDEPDIRDMLEMLLADEGYQATSVAHGREALHYLRSADPLPPLILLDLLMPIMDGIEFRQKQLNDARLAAVPVVVISTRVEAEQMAALNIEHALPKPLDLDELLKLVEQYCG